MFGGASRLYTPFDDTWELTTDGWMQQFTPNAPVARGAHSVSPLRDGTGVLVFGGFVNAPSVPPSNELWRLRWQHAGRYEVCTLDVDDDGDGLVGCADPDCWSVCSPLCPPGATCDPSWPRCGDGTCNTALETYRICPQDCTTFTAVCGDNFCDPGETSGTCPGDC
jgi:hypothetical protein